MANDKKAGPLDRARERQVGWSTKAKPSVKAALKAEAERLGMSEAEYWEWLATGLNLIKPA